MVSALLSFASPPMTRGETLGLAQAVAGLGRVIGPLAAGSILATLGPEAPFFVGSMLVVLAALIALPCQVHRHPAPDVQTGPTMKRGPTVDPRFIVGPTAQDRP